MLDIASGSGWFSGLAAQFGGAVVAFDRETEAVARLFMAAGARDLSILPLVMDFTRPTRRREVWPVIRTSPPRTVSDARWF